MASTTDDLCITLCVFLFALGLQQQKPPPTTAESALRAEYNTPMNQISIKTPKPKCRLYWCLIEFIDWRYSQSCWYFRLLWTSAPLTFSLVHLSPNPLPCVNKYMYTVQGYVFKQCVTGGEGIGGFRQINTCRQVPLLSIFKKSRHNQPLLSQQGGFDRLMEGWEQESQGLFCNFILRQWHRPVGYKEMSSIFADQ